MLPGLSGRGHPFQGGHPPAAVMHAYGHTDGGQEQEQGEKYCGWLFHQYEDSVGFVIGS